MITDEEGMSLPGVNVRVVGTNQGTISDIDGNYSIGVDNSNSVLEFSYVGYVNQEIKVGDRTSIDVQMEVDRLGLEEVVVVGYGTQKKVNLTGAVDVISGDELENRPTANVGEALQGTSPNLNISLSGAGGEPGAGNRWNIRGIGSLTGNSSPLILVDGVEMDVNNLDPESIESVSVLKDAAASAIYGSRAPFGVVLITTKKGKNE
jgi:TonB-dependent SusC/RagA subfamily outer membrane receptor